MVIIDPCILSDAEIDLLGFNEGIRVLLPSKNRFFHEEYLSIWGNDPQEVRELLPQLLLFGEIYINLHGKAIITIELPKTLWIVFEVVGDRISDVRLPTACSENQRVVGATFSKEHCQCLCQKTNHWGRGYSVSSRINLSRLCHDKDYLAMSQKQTWVSTEKLPDSYPVEASVSIGPESVCKTSFPITHVDSLGWYTFLDNLGLIE